VIQQVEIAALMPEPIVASKPHLDPERVSWYLGRLDKAEPVTVFDLEEGLLLADGHHRVEAAQRLGQTTIKADVRQGSRTDALDFAVALAQEQRGITAEVALDAIKARDTEAWGGL
jgi:hypothetical protein